MKKCPYCAEEIQDEAIVCRFCGRELQNVENDKKLDSLLVQKAQKSQMTNNNILIIFAALALILLLFLPVWPNDPTLSSIILNGFGLWDPEHQTGIELEHALIRTTRVIIPTVRNVSLVITIVPAIAVIFIISIKKVLNPALCIGLLILPAIESLLGIFLIGKYAPIYVWSRGYVTFWDAATGYVISIILISVICLLSWKGASLIK